MDSARTIIENISPWVGPSGTCVEGNESKLLDTVNQIRRLLWNKSDYEGLMEWPEICCVSQNFVLPARYDVVRAVKTCGTATLVQDQWYQIDFVSGDQDWVRFPELGFMQDRGGVVTKFRDYPYGPFFIELQAENGADQGKELLFEAINANGRWKNERIALLGAFDASVSVSSVIDFRNVTKPKTEGAVRVYAVDATNNNRLLLAIYQPFEVNPSYKKYRVPGYGRSSIRVRCKRKLFDLTDLDSLVEFPMESMIFGAQALTYRLSRDMEKFNESVGEAVREMLQEDRSTMTRGSTPIRFFPGPITENLYGIGYGTFD